ncbi:MAG: ABC transporter permease [Desulfuromonadales bacterium GWD2_61_12]|nr:MAG: ABC transporter permease [Desulfuromonadales bacterium GWC2_61_20]OGR36124.1 MAG: ABC transporter permease [Desulfuromonadales bacterium GWD2_61_12]HAD04883.1 ABC transporter permease [Desulfuromonas sp.]HBT83642.1 ABC transporter permease [Desulfuromonas sp.]
MNLGTIAFNNLWRRKARMVFLLAGLLLGVATVVTLLALTRSLTAEIEHKLDSFGANIVITPRSEELSLTYGGIVLGGVAVDRQELRQLDLTRLGDILNAANIAAIAPKVLGPATVDGTRVLLMGVSPSVEFQLKRWWSVDGRAPREGPEVVVGSGAARRFGLSAGARVAINGHPFTVTGTLHETGSQDDDLFLVPLVVAQELLGKHGVVSLVEVAALCAGCPIEDMVEQIQAVLPGAKVSAIQQVVKTRLHALEQFRVFSFGVAVVVILIGALVVFVTMMGSINERTREIGIFRALGFRRGHIVRLILTEAVAVSCLAGIFGYLSGMGMTRLLLPYLATDHPHLVWDPRLAAGAILLALLVGALASLYPALHASRMDPTEAFRSL